MLELIHFESIHFSSLAPNFGQNGKKKASTKSSNMTLHRNKYMHTHTPQQNTLDKL